MGKCTPLLVYRKHLQLDFALVLVICHLHKYSFTIYIYRQIFLRLDNYYVCIICVCVKSISTSFHLGINLDII